MATYCHPPRRQTISATQPPSHAQPLSSRQQIHSDLADSQTYIFPHPSSAPPSPSQSSVLSEPSDISLSAVSMSNYGSPGSGLCFTPDGYSPIRTTSTQHPVSSQLPLNLRTDSRGMSRNLGDPPRLDSVSLDVSVQALGNTHERASNRRNPEVSSTDPGIIGTKFRHPLARTSAGRALLLQPDKLPKAQPHHPLPRLSIPFLSFFASLLNIEDPTLDLLTSPPSLASTMLPMERAHSVHAWEDAHTVENLHLLTNVENGHQSVRRGMLSLDGRPLGEFTLIPLSGLWDMVAGLMSDGQKVLLGLSSLAHKAPDTD